MTAKEARDQLNEKLSKIDIQKAVDKGLEESIANECNKAIILTTIPKNDKNKARIMSYLTENGFTNILITSRAEMDDVYQGSSSRFFTVSFEF
jgi:SOS response regulatory protein OraA/RecX